MSENIRQEIKTSKGKKIVIDVEDDGSVHVTGASRLSGSFLFTDDFVGLKDEEIYVIINKELGAVPGIIISTNRPWEKNSFSLGFPPKMKAQFHKALNFGEEDVFLVRAIKGDSLDEESVELGKLPIVKKETENNQQIIQ